MKYLGYSFKRNLSSTCGSKSIRINVTRKWLLYYSTFNTLNYNDAKIYCNNRGFQLPVLDTKEKLNSLFNLTSNAVWVNVIFFWGKKI